MPLPLSSRRVVMEVRFGLLDALCCRVYSRRELRNRRVGAA